MHRGPLGALPPESPIAGSSSVATLRARTARSLSGNRQGGSPHAPHARSNPKDWQGDWSLACVLALGAELQRGDAGGDIEPGLALDRQGLQGDRTIEAADQGIGAQAKPGRDLGGGTGIAALKGA